MYYFLHRCLYVLHILHITPGGGGLAPSSYAEGLRAQVEERNALAAATRQRDIAAERADDERRGVGSAASASGPFINAKGVAVS